MIVFFLFWIPIVFHFPTAGQIRLFHKDLHFSHPMKVVQLAFDTVRREKKVLPMKPWASGEEGFVLINHTVVIFLGKKPAGCVRNRRDHKSTFRPVAVSLGWRRVGRRTLAATVDSIVLIAIGPPLGPWQCNISRNSSNSRSGYVRQFFCMCRNAHKRWWGIRRGSRDDKNFTRFLTSCELKLLCVCVDCTFERVGALRGLVWWRGDRSYRGGGGWLDEIELITTRDDRSADEDFLVEKRERRICIENIDAQVVCKLIPLQPTAGLSSGGKRSGQFGISKTWHTSWTGSK